MDNEKCNCIQCVTAELFPPTDDETDRMPVIIGIDVSTKYIAMSVIPALGDLNDIGGLGFKIESKRDTDRCFEAASKAVIAFANIDRAVSVTSVAIEMPRGFGGKLIPIVGAITGALGNGVEWYAPTTWQSIIRSEYAEQYLETDGKIKDRIHKTIAGKVPFGDEFMSYNEDIRDAICIAIAHRTETLNAMFEGELINERDMDWLSRNDSK